MHCIHCKGEVPKMADRRRVIICETCTQNLVRTYSLHQGEELLEKRLLRLAKARKKVKKGKPLPKFMIIRKKYV